MRFGHFDDLTREYCLDRPDTPQPWSTFLGSDRFGGFVNQHGGGYCLPGSATAARLIAPVSGRPVYLRDQESGDYWSATWQPVGKPLSGFRTSTRFGPGALVAASEWRALQSELVYFVPVDAEFEVWWLRLGNSGVRRRHLTVFACMEFEATGGFAGTHWIDECVAVLPGGKNGVAAVAGKSGWWMTMLGGKPAGFDGDRQRFRGLYRGAHNPEVVERGHCTGSAGYAECVCAALAREVVLEPGGATEVSVLVGPGDASAEGAAARAAFARPGRALRARARVRSRWRSWLDRLRVHTPDPEFDRLCNDWGAVGAVVAAERAAVPSLAEDSLGALTLRPECIAGRLAQAIVAEAVTPVEATAFALAVEALLGETGDRAWATALLPRVAQALAGAQQDVSAANSVVWCGWHRVAEMSRLLGLTDLRGQAMAALGTRKRVWDGGATGRLTLDPIVWDLLAGRLDGVGARRAFAALEERLGTAEGFISQERPATEPIRSNPAGWVSPGFGSNAGIQIASQARLAWAATQLGEGDRAFALVQSASPLRHNDVAEIRELEPFAYGSDIHSAFSPRPGLGGGPWTSAAASWMRYVIERQVLGLRPELAGLRIDPCLPAAWTGFQARRVFRGARVHLDVRAPGGGGHGVAALRIDGETVSGNLLPIDRLGSAVKVVAVIEERVSPPSADPHLARR
jgi:cellobiose phosphorylase